MHNISIDTIQNLALEIAEICKNNSNDVLLNKTRELYEKTLIFNYLNVTDHSDVITEKEKSQIEIPISNKIEPIDFFTTNEKPETEFETFIDFNTHTVDAILKAPDPIQETKKIMPKISQEEEMKMSVSGDVAAQLFENQIKMETSKKTLNDMLSQKQIIIGLNDRIAFVKHLFNDNLADFNRVISQINSFENEGEAKNFLENMVKTDYDWSRKEDYEQRLIQLIERRFL